MSDDPLRDAVRLVADKVVRSVRAHSPSGKIAGSWRTRTYASSAHITSHLIEAYMTQTNHRHPTFGRKGPGQWHAENDRNEGRTDWATRAMEEAVDDLQDVADEYASYIASELST